MADAPTPQVHEIFTYTRVSGRLDRLNWGMNAETSGPLAKALNRLSCIPFVSFPIDGCKDLKFNVGGESAGTFTDPKIDVISQHSKVSHFGKGEQTVLDETYRRGQEVTAADFGFDNQWVYERFIYHLEKMVSATLFVPRQAKVKLYKIAIYREGGHFDWHVDTTHSDSHHATVLVALNTLWTGGDFILRRNGVETRMDMKPKIELPPAGAPETQKPGVTLQAVAFYTDTEHKVEPITDGVRIVLQYDVEVQGWSDTNKTTEEHPRKNDKATHADDTDQDEEGEEDEDEGDGIDVDNVDSKLDEVQYDVEVQATHANDTDQDDEDDEDEEDEEDEDEGDGIDVDNVDSKLNEVQSMYEDRKDVIPTSLQPGDPGVVDEIVDIIQRLFATKSTTEGRGREKEVAFAMQYLYRRSSILPEYLKGSDSLLYQALSKTFEVTLHPVVLIEMTDENGCYGTSDASIRAYIFPHTGGDSSGDERDERRPMGGGRDATFYLPRSSAIRGISKQDYVEHAGNEAIIGEGKYFGGGMFVKAKGAAGV